eukprot:m.258239 g.258239  ORF g.258239 m.258239 type:complete len:341 (-) comp36305_c0_seq1:31-1053(-)
MSDIHHQHAILQHPRQIDDDDDTVATMLLTPEAEYIPTDSLFSFSRNLKPATQPRRLEFSSIAYTSDEESEFSMTSAPTTPKRSTMLSSSPTFALPTPSKSFQNSSSIRVAVLGAINCGKTALVSSFMNDTDRDLDCNLTVPTIGVDFKSRSVYLENNQAVRIQIWDTAGSKRFASFIPYYVRLAKAAMVVYDVNCRSSFNQVREYVELAKIEGCVGMMIVLVGTKIDGPERCVSTIDGQQLASELGIIFIETSAKSGLNIKEAFLKLVPQPSVLSPSLSSSPHINHQPTSESVQIPPTLDTLSLGHYNPAIAKHQQKHRNQGFCAYVSNWISRCFGSFR